MPSGKKIVSQRKKFRRTTADSILAGLLLIITLTSCAQSESLFSGKIPLGSIWDVVVNDRGEANWESASPVALEQHNGYALAKDATEAYLNIVTSEGNQGDDVQIAIRGMVENQDDPVVGLIGATTNEGTMRAASLVNFFNVPMIVPSAVGDNLFPSNNLWAFRLSAPGSTYAEYLFGTLLTKDEFGVDLENTNTTPKLNVGILYEGNTFGESAAVATARAAIQMGVGIEVYASFPPAAPNPGRLNILLNAVKDENIPLVYLISSDPAVATTLAQLFHNGFEQDSMPVLVGQAGGFASLSFLDSPEAEGIYVIRQKLIRENCPANVKSLYQGQSFAAVYLLDQAVQEVKGNQPTPEWYEVDLNTNETDKLAAFREDVRDILKHTNDYVPCIGQVAFDNTGQIKLPEFELIMMENGVMQIDHLNTFEYDILVRTVQELPEEE